MAVVKSVSPSSVMWICLCLAALTVSSISGAALSSVGTNAAPSTTPTTPSHTNATGVTNATATTAHTSTAPSTTTVPTTTAHHTTGNTTSSNSSTPTTQPSNHTTGNMTTPTINPNATTSASNGTSSVMTSVSTPSGGSTTPKASGSSGRKFDVASFFGGMALVAGVVLIIFIAVKCYTSSKKNNYNAM